MRVKLEKRFWMASVALWLIFLINLYGLYGNGFVKKYYLVPEVEHLAAAFFLAMWLSAFSRSIWFILTGLVLFTVLWEGLEYYIAIVPSASQAIQSALQIVDTAVEFWDTVLDIFLNFIGAIIFIFTDKKGLYGIDF